MSQPGGGDKLKSRDRFAVQNVSYGDMRAQLFLWQKSLSLMPVWAIAVIPIVGFLCRGLGHAAMEFGYGLTLAMLAIYFPAGFTQAQNPYG